MKNLNLITIVGEHLINLLGTSGHLLVAEKVGSKFKVTHTVHDYSEELTSEELLAFYHGFSTMVLPDKSIVDLRIYPEELKPTLEELEEFMKDERIKPLVYLASPYTHSDKEVVEENFRKISKVSAEMTADGFITISPITYGHTLLQFKEMPGDWAFWTSFCLSILEKCDKIVVVKMEGWDKSSGIAGELEYAKEHGIPVEYINPKEYLER